MHNGSGNFHDLCSSFGYFIYSVDPKRAVCFARNVIHLCSISANSVGKLNVLCKVHTTFKNLHQASLLLTENEFSAFLEIVRLAGKRTD